MTNIGENPLKNCIDNKLDLKGSWQEVIPSSCGQKVASIVLFAPATLSYYLGQSYDSSARDFIYSKRSKRLNPREHVWCSAAGHDIRRFAPRDDAITNINGGPWLYNAVAR